jgi:hypothetical protein
MDIQVIANAARRIVFPAFLAGATALGMTAFSSVASADPTGAHPAATSHPAAASQSRVASATHAQASHMTTDTRSAGSMHMVGNSGEMYRGTVQRSAPTKYLRERSAR